MTTNRIDAFAWPLVALDFEASGLHPDSYPIEIGVARWHGPGTPIAVWSGLIRTTLDWKKRGNWDPESIRFHGIARRSLEIARTPVEIMEQLNRRCGVGTLAFCDGGEHDLRWMRRLADAAGVAPRLLLGSWGHLLSHLSEEERDRAVNHRAPHEIAHRAGSDAIDHLKAVAHAIGADTPEIVAWDA